MGYEALLADAPVTFQIFTASRKSFASRTTQGHLILSDSLSSCRIRPWSESSLAGHGETALRACFRAGAGCVVCRSWAGVKGWIVF